MVCVFFAIFIQTSIAAVFRGKVRQHPKYPGHCHYEETNQAIGIGQSIDLDGECTQITCYVQTTDDDSQTEFYIEGISCGSIGVDPPCYIRQNISLSYPDCCPEPVCPQQMVSSESSSPSQTALSGETGNERSVIIGNPRSTTDDEDRSIDDLFDHQYKQDNHRLAWQPALEPENNYFSISDFYKWLMELWAHMSFLTFHFMCW